ncbi:glycosyltransferase family 2 protein [Deinococcus taklimakanensis]|uniref:Glycosyltransferase family 2 protein n=1 Tax=Deinococcus taklimakanensis TaxID=536443 RepID=A0ABW5P4V9_9DEIO
MSTTDSVYAVVVTFNRVDLLKRTLKFLEAQTKPLDKIIIVNNASTDATHGFLKEYCNSDLYAVYHLGENLGGAGGFSYGMRQAVIDAPDWIWIMDDDAFAAPDCLFKLLTANTKAEVRIPIQIDDTGRRYGLYADNGGIREQAIQASGLQKAYSFTFVGPLFSRRLVEKIGLPRADFFIGADDLEYAARIRGKGFEVVAIIDATISHMYGQGPQPFSRWGRKSLRTPIPAWKAYYSTRNGLAVDLIYSSGFEKFILAIRHVVKSVRAMPGEIFYEPEGFKKAKYRIMGLIDGIIGRFGKRVIPNRILSRK